MKKSLTKKVSAGLLAASVLAGGGTAGALLSGGVATAAAAPTIAATSSFVPYPLQRLVASGTITQAQASAIHDALCAAVQANAPAFGGRRALSPPVAANGALASALAPLVKNGTITQAQATAITDAFSAQMNAHFGMGRARGGGFGPFAMGGSGYGPPWLSTSAS